MSMSEGKDALTPDKRHEDRATGPLLSQPHRGRPRTWKWFAGLAALVLVLGGSTFGAYTLIVRAIAPPQAFPFSNDSVLDESLAAPNNDWIQQDGCDFVGGAYRVTVPSGDLALLCPEKNITASDQGFSYELTVKDIHGDPDNVMAGLAFNINVSLGSLNDKRGDLFVLSTRGTYKFLTCNSFVILSSPCSSLREGTLSHPATFPVRLGMTFRCGNPSCYGTNNTITFYINRQEVDTSEVDTADITIDGTVGAAVFNNNQPGQSPGQSTADFSHAQLWRL